MVHMPSANQICLLASSPSSLNAIYDSGHLEIEITRHCQ